MTHVLDTDHLSILQRGPGPIYAAIMANMSHHAEADVAASVVSLHEHARGAHAAINSGRTPTDVIRGYDHMFDIIEAYRKMPLLRFDSAAATEFDNLKAAKIRVSTMDLRIAFIALANKLVLVTRNARDFAQVPGLALEDWTK
jgi:tRNA(fMet)-specific endonuclease VapC